MRKTVKMLKDFAANPELSVGDYAKEQNISRPTLYERIYDFVSIYERMVNDDDRNII